MVFGSMEIPGYIIDRIIGEGGMSTVYLATQTSLNRKVALKVLAEHLFLEESFKRRFSKEGQIVALLDHPKIVTIYDIGTHNNRQYISQEFLPSGTLAGEIIAGLDVPRALFICKCIADALGYAHENGFVHRDIKPHNILFRNDRAKSAVLTDFGIAKATTQNNTTLTVAGQFCGSPAYMSPEQARGLVLDGRSDIYSLGVVLFQMLTGRVPFPADEPLSMAVRHLTDPVPRMPDSLRGRFQPIIDRCLAKNPDDRFAYAEELIEAIKAVEISPPELSAPVPLNADKFASSDVPTLVVDEDEQENLGGHAYVDSLSDRKSLDEEVRRVSSGARLGLPKVWVAALVGMTVLSVGLWFSSERWGFASIGNYWNRIGSGSLNDDVRASLPQASLEMEGSDPSTDVTPLETDNKVRVFLAAAETHAREGRLFPVDGDGAFSAYRAAIEAGGEQTSILSRMKDVLGRQQELALRALENGDLALSRSLVDAVLRVRPDDEDFIQLRGRVLAQQSELARLSEISELLRLAKRALRDGKLVDPPEDNANEIYQRILALDPSNETALADIDELVDRLEVQAQAAAAAGEFDRSVNLVTSGLRIDPEHEAFGKLRAKLATRRAHLADTTRLLEEAEIHRRAYRLVTPTGRNALENYQLVLRNDPWNEAAKKGIAQLVRDEERLARIALRNDDLQTAMLRIRAGLGIDQSDSRLLELQRSTDQAIRDQELLQAMQQKARAAAALEVENRQLRVARDRKAEEALKADRLSSVVETADSLEVFPPPQLPASAGGDKSVKPVGKERPPEELDSAPFSIYPNF